MKKPWNTPQLIELVRGRPEEAILAACKDGGAGVSPFGEWNNCNQSPSFRACGPVAPTAGINAIPCVTCSLLSAS